MRRRRVEDTDYIATHQRRTSDEDLKQEWLADYVGVMWRERKGDTEQLLEGYRQYIRDTWLREHRCDTADTDNTHDTGLGHRQREGDTDDSGVWQTIYIGDKWHSGESQTTRGDTGGAEVLWIIHSYRRHGWARSDAETMRGWDTDDVGTTQKWSKSNTQKTHFLPVLLQGPYLQERKA